MRTYFSIHPQTALHLAEMCGGMLRQEQTGTVSVQAICTDSREANSDTVFVAIRGEHSDGHQYITAALQNGCRCVICEHSCEELEKLGAAAIVVNDSELALAKLANAYQSYLNCKKIAVTGSVGKTTTKDLLASVLSAHTCAYKTDGNHNSIIGMPMSMVEIGEDSRYAVLEMGMSEFGEIERMSIAAEPDVAIITNIGTAHLAQLGSRENICRAKLEILSGLKDGGTLILNGDEPLLKNIGGRSYHTVYVSLFRENADFFAKNISVESDKTLFDVCFRGTEWKRMCIRVVGRHNVYAALYAIAVGVMENIPEEEIREGLLRYEPQGMRQHIYPMKGITVIEDCYNASPESVNAALEVLAEYSKRQGGRSVAVLGEMLELGEDSDALHRTVGAHLARQGIDCLALMGKGSNQIAVGARQERMPLEQISYIGSNTEPETAAQNLCTILQDGDVVLFKASRAVGAEKVIAALKSIL